MAFEVMTLSETAAARVREIVESRDETVTGLRLGIKKGGCAGMEYTMDFVDSADDNDVTIEHDGARVVIAPTAQMFLFGTEIDYETSLLESGFKFNKDFVLKSCLILSDFSDIAFKVDNFNKSNMLILIVF